MLVLSRRDGQQIVVGDDIVIKVLSIDGGRVRMGIDAPMNVQIRRAELPLKEVPTTRSWHGDSSKRRLTPALS